MPAITTLDAKKKIIVNNAPIAQIWEVVSGALVDRYTFANVLAQLKMAASSADAAGTEKVEIQQGNGWKIQFNKVVGVIKGEDETDATPAGSSTSATGKGEITLTIKEAPYNSGVATMTSFIESLRDKKDSFFLIAIPTGYTPYGQTLGTPVVDGWAFMIGKRTSDIDIAYGDGAKELTVTFASNSEATLDATDFTGLTMFAIKERGQGNELTPPTLISGDATNLLAGDVVIKETTYA